MKKKLVEATVILLFLCAMLWGVFGALGVVSIIWGPQILDTALGSPPQRDHPAFWTGLFLFLPGWYLASCAAVFGIFLPLYAKFGIPLGHQNRLLKQFIKTRYIPMLEALTHETTNE